MASNSSRKGYSKIRPVCLGMPSPDMQRKTVSVDGVEEII